MVYYFGISLNLQQSAILFNRTQNILQVNYQVYVDHKENYESYMKTTQF